MEGRGRVYVCEVARCVLSELYNCIMIVCSSRGASAHLPGITKQHPANLFGQHSTCNFMQRNTLKERWLDCRIFVSTMMFSINCQRINNKQPCGENTIGTHDTKTEHSKYPSPHQENSCYVNFKEHCLLKVQVASASSHIRCIWCRRFICLYCWWDAQSVEWGVAQV